MINILSMNITLDIDTMALAIGICFTIVQLRQNARARYIEIELSFKKRYDELNEDREEFNSLYRDQNFDLKKLKNKKLYEKVILWEKRYFRYEHDKFLLAHVRKVMPKDVKKDWNHDLLSAMENPVHQQVWSEEISQNEFFHEKFYTFIDTRNK